MSSSLLKELSECSCNSCMNYYYNKNYSPTDPNFNPDNHNYSIQFNANGDSRSDNEILENQLKDCLKYNLNDD